MKTWRVMNVLVVAAAFSAVAVQAADSDDVTWLIQTDGHELPTNPAWTAVGAVKAEVVDSALHIVDDSNQKACFRAGLRVDASSEIIVEARVKVGAMKGWRGGQSVWPWRDGAPIGVLISNGRRQEGLVLTPRCVRTFTDRFFLMDTTHAFHDYRLVISGGDMRVYVDGLPRIQGKDAFWKPADSADPFIQIGSNSGAFTGDAYWEYVRLGVRKPTSSPAPARLKITVSEPWEITRPDKARQTRPYLYNMGQGLLLMSVAQGPDAYYEPYGVLKSTDEGKTWTPIKGLDQITYAPQPMLRMKDGTILGVSRWNKLEAGVLVGRTVHFDPQAEHYTMFENQIRASKEATALQGHGVLVFDRHVFEEQDGSVLAVVYGHAASGRSAQVLRSTDRGRTWHYLSTIGRGGEPGVARLPNNEMTAILRQGGMMPFLQVWSRDGGQTWSEPAVLEEGSVDPDLEYVSNGVLACSYGRPASCIMFSLDHGRTWASHRVVSDETGYNYTSIREIRPGRLLYVHDAPTLRAVYIDVELISQ